MTGYENDPRLAVLRQGITPFDKFVSRGGVKDTVDIPNPRGTIDPAVKAVIKDALADGKPRFLPMLGGAGSGKTHAYWAFKDMQQQFDAGYWTIVYVPSPPASIRTLFHVYTCITSEIAGFVSVVSRNLVHQHASDMRKGWDGYYSKRDVDLAISRAMNSYPGRFEPCLKAFLIHGMHPDQKKRDLARRWILGEAIDEKDFDELSIASVMEADEICLAMMELIAMNFTRNGGDDGSRIHTLVLFFDEFESPFRTHGDEAQKKFIDTIEQIYSKVDNVVIIAAVLKDVWGGIHALFNHAMQDSMETPVEIFPFSFGDVTQLFIRQQQMFWEEQHMAIPENPFYPLNVTIVQHIFNKARGNPRDTIKLSGHFIERIASGALLLDDLTGETASGDDASVKPASAAKAAVEAIDSIIKEEVLVFEVNAASLVWALVKGIIEISYVHKQEDATPEFQFEFKFSMDNKERTLAALLKGDARIGIDVPAVKTFDRSGGVAAYYTARRLADALESKCIDRGAIIMPKDTSGEKLQYLLDNTKGLFAIRVDQAIAETIVKTSLDPRMQLSDDFYALANSITGWNIACSPGDICDD